MSVLYVDIRYFDKGQEKIPIAGLRQKVTEVRNLCRSRNKCRRITRGNKDVGMAVGKRQ